MKSEKIINFMGWRKIAMTLSLLLIVISIGSLATKGLKLGLDFTGGTQVEVNFSEPADISKIRSVLNDLGLVNPVAVLFGSDTEVLIRTQGKMQDGAIKTISARLTALNTEAKIESIERAPSNQSEFAEKLVFANVTQEALEGADIFEKSFYGKVSYSSEDEVVVVLLENSMDTAYIGQMLETLSDATASEVALRRSEFVGPQIGAELRDKGGLGMLVALIIVMFYIGIRFQAKFSFGAVIALIHDVIIVLGFFAFLQIDFDLTVLAALLAVIGYSLNDTIVVFDRIRENFRKIRKEIPETVINISLTETLERTLITSLTTLIVLVILFYFGGEIIHGFASALIVGVMVGTYSSIYVSANTLMLLDVTKEDLMAPVSVKEGADQDNLLESP